ncbi:alpha/beta fold hydrolase [Micromonospora sp. NPDC049047]|uniref:thioesterase II family protein n=1 Tax=Micromonospora sp. NPDC049047 TaxID=3155645 RepID=UPI0033EF09B0
MSQDLISQAQWIRRFHPSADSRLRLICLPHAGGSASFYFPASEALSPTIEVLAVQYPGRQDRRFEPCLASIADLADGVFAALEPSLGEHPIAIFGHSMGAIVGYELARRLETGAGIAPVRLFASGRRPPANWRQEHVHRLTNEGIVAELQRLNGTHSRLLADQDMLRSILPALRADYRAIETYRHLEGPVLGCPITVLVGDADPTTGIEDAYAWQAHTTGACDVRVFTGGHFFMSDQPTKVVDLISNVLLPER